MSTTTATDWTETYQELQETINRQFHYVDRESEEVARRIIEPLSSQVWAMIRGRLTPEDYEDLAKQIYCVAVQAVMYHLERLDEE